MRGARPRGSPGQGCPASSIGCARGMTADCARSGTFTNQVMECCDGQRDDIGSVAYLCRLAVMMHVRYPLSLRNVEDLLHERGIDKSHPPPATAGSFNPTALQADCLGFCPGTVAQLLEVVLTKRGRMYFTD